MIRFSVCSGWLVVVRICTTFDCHCHAAVYPTDSGTPAPESPPSLYRSRALSAYLTHRRPKTWRTPLTKKL